VLEKADRHGVLAALGGNGAEAFVGLAHPLRVAVHLGLANDAPQQLLGVVEVAAADHHRGVQQLERA
jgi:hypothetical protein